MRLTNTVTVVSQKEPPPEPQNMVLGGPFDLVSLLSIP